MLKERHSFTKGHKRYGTAVIPTATRSSHSNIIKFWKLKQLTNETNRTEINHFSELSKLIKKEILLRKQFHQNGQKSQTTKNAEDRNLGEKSVKVRKKIPEFPETFYPFPPPLIPELL